MGPRSAGGEAGWDMTSKSGTSPTVLGRECSGLLHKRHHAIVKLGQCPEVLFLAIIRKGEDALVAVVEVGEEDIRAYMRSRGQPLLTGFALPRLTGLRR